MILYKFMVDKVHKKKREAHFKITNKKQGNKIGRYKGELRLKNLSSLFVYKLFF